jgi:hypothetical protein
MKKLTLKMHDLRVETFTTAEQSDRRGTVAGHYGTTHTLQGPTCDDSTCAAATCDYTVEGYMTSPGPDHPCIICRGGGW